MPQAGPDPARADGSFSGTWYVMPTTFEPDGSLDLASQRSLTEAVLTWGADGLTVLGVMGEASALDTGERAAVIRAVVEAAAGTPVAVGASSSALHTTIALVRQAAACGAGAVMVAAPPLLRAVDTYSRWVAESGVSRSRLIIPRIAFRGVRISWLMLARNSLFDWLASSARSFSAAYCSASSRRMNSP